ncbi:MAG: type III-B CRISPR module-associated protein Cmr5 [Thermofilaceae archaeon]|uniref:CRISPR type III-B/RAMP module-associated protein Cmr5 n=1 Tax=Thermofilum pendens TaxID=2269 RepID=A0A7C4H956_THEPE
MSAEQLRDPVRAALDIFMTIRGELERRAKSEKEKTDFGRDLRARARDAPELIEEVGLVPALSFFYSKSDKIGYELMLKAILLYLQRIQIVPSNINLDAILAGERNTDAMIDLLRDLLKWSTVVVPILRPFLVEFKRLCEATWSERGSS